MFKCKVCIEKEKRIAELKDQIKHLKSLVYPSNDPFNESLVSREADSVLNNTGEILESTAETEEQEEEIRKFEAEVSERERILSGNY